MNISRLSKLLVANGLLLTLVGCNSAPSQDTSCTMPGGHDLDQAISASRFQLETGCATHFDRYFTSLLSIASGDPRKENKGKFSDFLLWANQADLISKNQARDYYNRYFNVKFMALRGDYNNCSHTCPNRQRILVDMERELSDKERGLLRISLDNQAYYRADELYQEVELVLEATCTACAASR